MSDKSHKSYADAMNEWASREGRASFTERSRVSMWMPDPFSHPLVKLIGYVWRLALIALLGAGVYWFMLRSHLGSKEFTAHLSTVVKDWIGADKVVISQIAWTGDLALAQKLSLDGGTGSFFRSFEAEDVRFRVPIAMLMEKKWDLRRIDASMVKLELRSGGLGATASVPSTPDDVDDAMASFDPPVISAPAPKATLNAAAPDPDLKTETGSVDSRVLDLDLKKDGFNIAPKFKELGVRGLDATRFSAQWGSTSLTRGELTGAALSVTRTDDGAWVIESPSSQFSQNWLRGLQVSNLQARIADNVLTLNESPVQMGEFNGTLGGRVRLGDVPMFELTLKGDKLPLASFANRALDQIFGMQASGELRIGGSTNLATGITIDGTVTVDNGFVRGLPVQQALADVSRRIRFRGFAVTGGTVEFSASGGQVDVKSFVLASRSDISLRGSFKYVNEEFAGEMQIGVDPALLEKLAPSLVAEFFPKEEAGKLWMTTKLEGPIDRLTAVTARSLTDAHAEITPE